MTVERGLACNAKAARYAEASRRKRHEAAGVQTGRKRRKGYLAVGTFVTVVITALTVPVVKGISAIRKWERWHVCVQPKEPLRWCWIGLAHWSS